MKTLLVGGVAFDRIMDFSGQFADHILPDKIHQLSISFNIADLKQTRGGTSGNIAYSLALLGGQSSLVSSVGNDIAEYKSVFEGLGIDLEHVVEHADITTAGAYIITDKTNSQIAGFYMGAMQRETNYDGSDLTEGDVVLLNPGNPIDWLRVGKAAAGAGSEVIFDPGQTLPFLEDVQLTELLGYTTTLIVNDYELAMVLERTGFDQAGLQEQVNRLIVTYGAEGSKLFAAGKEHNIPVAAVSEVVDPTGAGDAYRAGLLRGRQAGLDWLTSCQLGVVAAAYAVEHYGPQEHEYTLQEFGERYRQTFGQDCPLT